MKMNISAVLRRGYVDFDKVTGRLPFGPKINVALFNDLNSYSADSHITSFGLVARLL